MAAKRRAPHPLRLERGEGQDRAFWEISRDGAIVRTRHGKGLNAGRTHEKEHPDVASAKRAIDKLIADKREEGYGDPSRPGAPGASSVKGVSVRNEELEALIDADPDDAQGYLVYADWLQQHGDVRGELIVVQHGRSVDPSDAALERAETTLLREFEAELLGPIAKYSRIRMPDRSFKGLAWRYGFLHAARLHREDSTLEDAVRAVIAHPSGRFLQRLVISGYLYGNETDLVSAFEVLAKVAPRSLDGLVIGDGCRGADLASLWTAMPRLRSLVLAGAGWCPPFGEIRAERLEELVVVFAAHEELAAIASAEWPALKRLTLTLTVPTASSEGALTPLLASKAMPSLTHLSVERWLTREGDTIVPHDSLALEVLRFAAARGLERLDLCTRITDAGAAAILEEKGLTAIGAITMPAETITSASWRRSLSEKLPNLGWTDGPVEVADLEMLEE